MRYINHNCKVHRRVCTHYSAPIHILLLTCAVSAISLEALYAGAVEAAHSVSAGGILMTGVQDGTGTLVNV